MKYDSSESSSNSLSSFASDGTAVDVNNLEYEVSTVCTIARNGINRKANSSSDLDLKPSDEDRSSSINVQTSDLQVMKKQFAAKPRSNTISTSAVANGAVLGNESPFLEAQGHPEADLEEKAAWIINMMKPDEDGPTKSCRGKKGRLLIKQEVRTLIKSNSLSTTRADNLFKTDYSTASSNSYHAHSHNLMQSHRFSTGSDSHPMNLQKRYGSQGPASLRGRINPSPGTPSRSSFSGVPTSLMINKGDHLTVSRMAVNDANGKLLPLYNLPQPGDQDAINVNSTGSPFVSKAYAIPRSKWDDAERWLVNASPSHPSQHLTNINSKQAPNCYTIGQGINAFNPTNQVNINNNSQPAVRKGQPSGAVKSSRDVLCSPPLHPQAPQGADYPQCGVHATYKCGTEHDGVNNQLLVCTGDNDKQSRSLVPLASSSSDCGQMQEDGDSYSAAFSDSEVSNVKDERKAAFVRSTSHKHSEATHTLKYMQKGQNRNRSDVYKGSMEEALHNIERLKHGSRSPRVSDYQQLPRIHDVHAVEIATKLDASHSTDKVLCRLSNVGSTGTTRLVVQGGKLVGMWGSGAMRDASTDVSPQVSKSRRDMGTQMTPAGSSKNTPGSSPERKGRAPARHSTPNPASIHAANKSDQGHILAEMNDVEKARMNQVSDTVVSSSTMSPSGSNASIANRWKRLQDSLSVGGISEQPSLPLNKELHSPMLKAQDVEPSHEKLEDNAAPPTQNAAWEEERSKYVSKFAREEARIDAWENHQKAKAEAELKKLEMKLERLRAQATEKIMNKMAAAHLRAEEMRATARAHQAEQLAKALERANSLSKRGSGYLSESLGVCFSIMP